MSPKKQLLGVIKTLHINNFCSTREAQGGWFCEAKAEDPPTQQ